MPNATEAQPFTSGGGALDFGASGNLYATHQIHPYAARCPPPLVDWALTNYSSEGATILDPMAGSGTTLVEAVLNRRIARGVDIDPLARLISKVKATYVEPEQIDAARAEIVELLAGKSLDDTWRPNLPDLGKWFRDDVCRDLSRIRDAIEATDCEEDVADLLWVAFSSLIVARTSVANARDLVHSRHHYREWVKDPECESRYVDRLKRAARMMTDFGERLDGYQPDVEMVGTDATAIPIEAESIDLVFTSPPYVSALDYVRAHMFAVTWMPEKLDITIDEYRALGRDFIGTERASLRDANIEPRPPVLGIADIDSVVAELADVHRTHAWIVWRYFREMQKVLGETARVLRDDGRAVFVVCPSNIRKRQIPTHSFFATMAEAIQGDNGRLEVEALHERTIHDRRRVMPYLESAFGPRMRTEYVLVLRRSS